MKACGGLGSAPNPAGELAPSRVQTPPPVKHTSLHNRLGVVNALKLTYIKLEFPKFSGGQIPGPQLLDPPLNTMNRAAIV